MTSKPLYTLLSVALLSASCAVSQAQVTTAPPPPPPAADGQTPAAPITRSAPRPARGSNGTMQKNDRADRRSAGPAGFGGPGGMSPGSHIAPPGMWWKSPEVAQRLTLTDDQQKKMDDIFQKSRLQLIDLKANVEKQDAILEPMLDANPPDTNKVLSQIDHVAQARAELEKGNARMLLGIRAVLTADQWTKLQADRGGRHAMFKERGGPGMHGGPDGGPGGPGMGREMHFAAPDTLGDPPVPPTDR